MNSIHWNLFVLSIHQNAIHLNYTSSSLSTKMQNNWARFILKKYIILLIRINEHNRMLSRILNKQSGAIKWRLCCLTVSFLPVFCLCICVYATQERTSNSTIERVHIVTNVRNKPLKTFLLLAKNLNYSPLKYQLKSTLNLHSLKLEVKWFIYDNI